jgi:hypothetical protein
MLIVKTLTMKNCPSCGKQNLQSAKFCRDCGTSLAEPTPGFATQPMAKALVKLIDSEFLTGWSSDENTLTVVSKQNPEAIAIVQRGTRSPSTLLITAPVGVFHQNLDKQWNFEDELFTPAELSVLNDQYMDYYSDDRPKSEEFGEKFHDEHYEYIAIGKQYIIDGIDVDMFDGSNSQAIVHCIATIKGINSRKKKKNAKIFPGLEGIEKWQVQRNFISSGKPVMFAAVPGTSSKSKKFPTLGYVALAEEWQAMLVQYEYEFSPVEESTVCILRSIFEIRDVWMETFSGITNSCNGHIAPASQLPKAVPFAK